MRNVKNTIGSYLTDTLIPHSCSSCGAIGSVLCQSCKNDILNEPFTQCIQCLAPTGRHGVCATCHLPYSQAWCVGWRDAGLKRLTDQKFFAVRPAIDMQATLLDNCFPELPIETRLVAVPTVRSHIRQRGFAHAERLARRIAARRDLVYDQVIARVGDHVQHGATRQVRLKQAADSFAVDGVVQDVPYLVVDDIYTTGATVGVIAKLLREAGASDVWVAVVARQPDGRRGV